MAKRGVVVLLVGINLVLGATLLMMTGAVPAAYGQAVPLGSNYLTVSAVVQSNKDALFVIDLANRELHCFEVDRTTRRIVHRDRRDLQRDFRS